VTAEHVPAEEVEVLREGSPRPLPTEGPRVSHVLLRGRASGPGAYRLAADALTAAILDDMANALGEEEGRGALDP
jgi:hypothetical protein